MSLFSKKTHMSKELTALKALNGKAAEAITADEIKAANQELVDAGFNGVELSPAGAWVKAGETLNEKTTALETAEESLATAEERIIALEAELKEYKPDEAAAASGNHSEPKADKDKIVEAEGQEDAGEAVNAEMFSKVKDMGIDIPK
jgi:hypothetical protein